jgi:hypothetical protein
MRTPLIGSAVLSVTLLCFGAFGWAQTDPFKTEGYKTPQHSADQSEIEIAVRNKSEPVFCAEKDNVALEFSSSTVRHFRIQAVHPAYIGTISTDRWAPDFTSCDMTEDPSFHSDHARRVTFYESPDLWITGYTYPSFWRPNTVPVRVGDKTENGLHMIQVWVRYRERAEEVLVLYPPDGYWRARPLPFGDMRWTAYGSSFLIGPVEVQQRPIVALKDVLFDPATKSFTLSFARGGSAVIALETLDQRHMALDVSLNDLPKNLPFGAMRSMYTTQTNADVAQVAWRQKNTQGWGEAPIMSYSGGNVSELWAGRTTPSNHNMSAPDMVFGPFYGASK